MPLPTSLVVKNGSKILSRTSAGMPWPVSSTSISTYSAGDERLFLEVGAFGGGKVARAQQDVAAVAHRVARVDDQIDDHLLELVEVGLDQPEIAAVHDVEIDRLADQPAQQHLQFGQHVAELQGLRPQRLPAREGEQLPHQARRAIGVLLDLHDVLEGRIGRPVIGEQQIGIADDRGQHIVEVMRDAAGELADRLHLLALREILLQRALLGGVEREDRRARALVAARIGGRDEEARRTRRARALERGVDRGDVALALRGGGDRVAQGGAVALGDEAKIDGPSLAGAGLQRRRREPREGGVGAQHRARGVDRGDRHRRRIEEAREAHFGGAQVLALFSPGARLMTSVREGPGEPSLEKATRCRMRTGRKRPWRGLRSTSNCSVFTSPGRPETRSSAPRRRPRQCRRA